MRRRPERDSSSSSSSSSASSSSSSATGSSSSPELVSATFEGLSQARPLAAIDTALFDNGGGLDDEWHEFARHNWNAPPVDRYRSWDRLTTGTTADDYQSIDAPRSHEWYFGPMEHLSAAYNAYDFGSVSSVGHVTVRNPLRGEDDARLQAIVELADGTRKVENWTEREELGFCRTDPDERIVNLVLIASYVDYLDAGTLDPGGPVEVEARRECYPETWAGRASGTVTNDGLTESWSATYTTNRFHQNGGGASYGYGLEGDEGDSQGTMQWSISGTNGGGCQVSGSATIDVVARLDLFAAMEPKSYATDLRPVESTQVTSQCPGQAATTFTYFPLNCDCAAMRNPFTEPYAPSLTSIQGAQSYTANTGEGVSWAWKLVPGSTPPPP